MISSPQTIAVEVAYAEPHSQCLIALSVLSGSTLIDAIRQSGILVRYPHLDVTTLSCGVFGKRLPPGHLLRAGDRVEIYRPLPVDPKVARRQRARQGMSRRAG